MMGLTPLIFLALSFPPPVETQTFELKFCEPPIPEWFRRANPSFVFITELELGPSGGIRSAQRKRNITNDFRDIIEIPKDCFRKWRFPFGESQPKKATVSTAFYWSGGGWWSQWVSFGEIVIQLISTELGWADLSEIMSNDKNNAIRRETRSFALQFCRPSVPSLLGPTRTSLRLKGELKLSASGEVQSVSTTESQFGDLLQTAKECFLNWRFPLGESQPKKANVVTDWHVDGGWKLQSIRFGDYIIRLQPHESGYYRLLRENRQRQ